MIDNQINMRLLFGQLSEQNKEIMLLLAKNVEYIEKTKEVQQNQPQA